MPTVDLIAREDARARGAIYFRTGRPCVRGHDAARYVSSGGCTECAGRFSAGERAGPAVYSIVETDGLRTVELQNRSMRGVYQWRRTAAGAFEFRSWGMSRRDVSAVLVPWVQCITIESEPDVLAMLLGASPPAVGAPQPTPHYVLMRYDVDAMVSDAERAAWLDYLRACVDAWHASIGRSILRIL